jgi:hypothetical protein
VAHDLRSYESDSANVGIAVFLTKAEPFRQMSADDVAVEQGHLPAPLEEEYGKDIRRRGLARAT